MASDQPVRDTTHSSLVTRPSPVCSVGWCGPCELAPHLFSPAPAPSPLDFVPGANATGDIYKEDFEGPLLTATTAFYGLESQLYLRGNDASVYLARAALRLREEESRAQQCFQGSTLQKLLRATEQQLLQNCGREVLQLPATGLAFMLTNSRVDDLRRVYELFGRIPGGHGLVCNLLQEHVRVCCSETVSGDADTKRDADAKGAGAAGEPGVPAPKDPGAKGGSSKVAVAFVQSLLDLQAKYDSLLRAAFMTERLPSRTMVPDPQFAKAVSRAMEMTLRSAARAPEYLSLFIDHRLRKDSKALSWAESTQELEKTMSATMRLFRLLQDKDVFERYYKQHFSKRLIGNKSVSDEGERSMISRLKAECGYSFTSKLERMYQDITVSHDFMAEYKKAQAAASAASQPSLDLSVRVLQTGCWPVNKVACVLPPAVAAPCRSFSDFYSNKHSGRVLTWLPTLGTAELLSLFDRSKHTLAVSTAAMLVLLQFNDAGAGKGLSYEQLENACGLPGPELQRTLQTLACGKARVLTKQPMSRRVSPGDRFRVNTAFTSKLKRVKIQYALGCAPSLSPKPIQPPSTLGPCTRQLAAVLPVWQGLVAGSVTRAHRVTYPSPDQNNRQPRERRGEEDNHWQSRRVAEVSRLTSATRA